jgi:hypothetical protein
VRKEGKGFTTEDTEESQSSQRLGWEKRDEEIRFVRLSSHLGSDRGGWSGVAAYGFGDAELRL